MTVGVLNFRKLLENVILIIPFNAMSNRLKYLPRLILVLGKAAPLADINKDPLKDSP